LRHARDERRTQSVTLVVGVTGNIASGKSTVAARLAAHGATLIDADALAREALAPGGRALSAVAAHWPSAIAADGSLDRAALRRVVFAEPSARSTLNAIVHPEVARLRDMRLAEARARGDAIVVYDVPLLFEAGLEGTVDVIVFVDASEETRLRRLVEGRGLGEREARAMMNAQMPPAPKRARSHHVVDNDGTREALDAQVDQVWRALAQRTRDD
jgi:dephospho-CoA kinase